MENLSIHSARIFEEFCELVAIDSVSFHEREMADVLKEKLTSLGFAVSEDSVGELYGGNAGNIYGFLKGNLPGRPILLCAHMDTVKPGIGKKAVPKPDGQITSGGDTVLGADDVCGIVEILEAVRVLQEQKLPHRDIEVLFPIAEELFIKGTAQMNFDKIQAREAYVLDLSGAVGTAALKAPSLITFSVTVDGKAAHAGFNPEEGIHAIALMSRALSHLPQGRVDADTTFNVGTIAGGTLVNIVPERCTCCGEIRSYSHERALEVLEEIKALFRRQLEGSGADFQLEYQVELQAYQTPEDAPVVQRFVRACQKLGLPGTLTKTFGGSDNNSFALHGIQGIVLSCGMYNCHSTKEYTLREDLQNGAALVAALLSLSL